MNEQDQIATTDKAETRTEGSKPAPNRARNPRAVSDPRDVATLVLARMNQVNLKKDELTIAIKGLSDITQQLARAYAEQMQFVERLAKRVKALEAAAASGASADGATAPSATSSDRLQ